MDRRWKYEICVTDVVENMINLIIVVKIKTIIVVSLRGEMKISKSCDRQIWQIWSFWWKSRQRWLRGTFLESFHIAKMGSEQILQNWSVWWKLEWFWHFWESRWKYENQVADKYDEGDTITDCVGQILWAFILQRWVQEYKLGKYYTDLFKSSSGENLFFLKHETFLNVFNIADNIRL